VTFKLAAPDVPASKTEVSIGGGQPVGDTPRVAGTL